MTSIPAVVRPLLYAVAGALVGFLFLAEFAMITLPLVQIALLLLALAGLAGALRGRTSLGLWSLFAAVAAVIPLLSDARIVGLPRCGTVPAGVACLAGTREVGGQLAMELLVFVCGVAGAIVIGARVARRSRSADEIIDAGR